jgi:hypothetical protein
LPRGEWRRRLVLKPLEECLGRRIGLLVDPLLNPQADEFKWVHFEYVEEPAVFVPLCQSSWRRRLFIMESRP